MRKIDGDALTRVFRYHKPTVWDENEQGYDRGALDMWKLLYSAVVSAPTLPNKSKAKEDKDAQET
jgi:hypothetical protein